MTLAYKVEELLALRDSVSESAVSIDKFADEDVIKEHVLRPSASACLIGTRSDNSLRALAAPTAIGSTAAAKKPSPSPSIKRGKAERLLKEHGSPPGMRVTAGGRVVPSDLPPLSNARFSANNLRGQPSRVVSPSDSAAAYTGADNNINKLASHSQGLFTNNGQAYLFVDNQLVPINNSYTMSAPYPYGNGATPSTGGGFTDPVPLESAQMQQYAQQPRFQASAPVPQAPQSTPFVAPPDVTTLKQKHAAKTQELKYLEQVEVLRAPHESEEWRAATVEKKRKLVIEIDKLRRSILQLDPNAFGSSAQSVSRASNHGPSNSMAPSQVPVAPQFQQPLPTPMYAPTGLPMMVPVSGTFAPPPFVMYGPSFNAPQAHPAAVGQIPEDMGTLNGTGNGFMAPIPAATIVDVPRVTGRDNLSQSPTSNRRSHAVEIKPPRDMMTKNRAQGSTLNPKSPTYEPSKPSLVVNPRSASSFQPPTPSPKPTPDRMFPRASVESIKNAQHTLKPKASLSSVSTADFFPMNTHEHSMTKTGPPKSSVPKQGSSDDFSGPITPDKKWGSGRKNRLNTDSLRLTKGSPNNATKASGQESPWMLTSAKNTSPLPTTFQEGYQKGLKHAGLPLNPEVIRGFMHGLMDVMKEMSISLSQSNTPARATPSQEPPRDSGVSMGFSAGTNRSNTANQENRRLSTVDGLSAPLEGLGQSPTSKLWTGNQNVQYVLCNEAADLSKRPRTSKTDSLQKMNEVKTFTPRANDNGEQKDQLSRQLQEQKDQVSRPLQAETQFSSKLTPTQYSGNQTATRAMGGLYGRLPSSAGKRESPSAFSKPPRNSASKSAHEQRYSGFDGAMDDLQGIFENQDFYGEEASTEASCFKGYSSKGKQKATSSPTKSSESPKKSSEHSPAKARLEQIANSFKTNKKDDRRSDKVEDVSAMSPAEKRHWRENWRKRFVHLANREKEEVEKEKAEQEYRRFRNMNQY